MRASDYARNHLGGARYDLEEVFCLMVQEAIGQALANQLVLGGPLHETVSQALDEQATQFRLFVLQIGETVHPLFFDAHLKNLYPDVYQKYAAWKQHRIARLAAVGGCRVRSEH
jgi:hypothetical protein